MLRFPCFLCRGDLEIRTDKNGKRYFICDVCGVQAFVRRKSGIDRLVNLARDSANGKLKIIPESNGIFQACTISNEIEDLKREISRLKRKGGFLTRDADTRRAIKALKVRVSALLSMLERRAKDVP